MRKRLFFPVLALGLVALLTLAACSPFGGQPQGGGMMGSSGGMMEGQGGMMGGQGSVTGPQGSTGTPGPYQQPTPTGSGDMMGGQGGMMGGQGSVTGPQGTPGTPGPYQQPYQYGTGGMMGQGMMGGWGGYNPQATPITIEQAADSVRRYLNAYGKGLSLAEVMEFAWNFYAEVEEEDTGIHAMELLIVKYTGQVYPEMGPNMMWNTKYGMMTQMMGGYYTGGVPTAAMPVTPEQAKVLAQQFLDANLAGLTAADADTFYGYYTLHTLRGGQVEGMLSVNGSTGAVWYHTWHGPFVGMKEFHNEESEH